MRGNAANDRAVLRIARGVRLAGEETAGERVEGQVDRVDRLEHDEGVPGDRRAGVVSVEPLHRFGRMGDRWGRLAELERQWLDQLDVAGGNPCQHRRDLVDRPWARLEPDSRAALARIVQLQLVLLGRDVPGQRWRPNGLARGALGGRALASQEFR